MDDTRRIVEACKQDVLIKNICQTQLRMKDDTQHLISCGRGYDGLGDKAVRAYELWSEILWELIERKEIE